MTAQRVQVAGDGRAGGHQAHRQGLLDRALPAQGQPAVVGRDVVPAQSLSLRRGPARRPGPLRQAPLPRVQRVQPRRRRCCCHPPGDDPVVGLFRLRCALRGGRRSSRGVPTTDTVRSLGCRAGPRRSPGGGCPDGGRPAPAETCLTGAGRSQGLPRCAGGRPAIPGARSARTAGTAAEQPVDHRRVADRHAVGSSHSPMIDRRPVRPQAFCGKPRFRPPWLGSSQRLVMTLPRVKKCTPSAPCAWVSPKRLFFHPPKE